MAEPDAQLFATRWVHVFEEDTADGEVYRPEDAHIPLSRRPREQLQLRPDGSATIFAGGPDDRAVGRPATWQKQGEQLIVRSTTDPTALRIVARSAERLVVRRGRS
jgi:hypothetical protein